MDRKIYLSIMAALASAVAVWLSALLAAPIAKPLAWALIIGISTLPHYNRLAHKFPDHPNRSAGVMVLAITVCLIMPVAGIIIFVAENAAEWYAEGERLVLAFSTTGAGTLSHLPFADKIIAIGEWFDVDPAGLAAKLADGASGYILNLTADTAKNLGELLFTLSVALFILFFVYRDGERTVSIAIARFASDQRKARSFYSEICATTSAVTVGTILTCLAQGVVAGAGYFAAGVPAPVICAALTALAALVPVVGTAVIWVPLALLLAINGAYLKAALLAIWCLLFVGLADNAMRPLAIGAKSNIPVMAVVLGAVCGVIVMGVLGLILGPVLFALLMSAWRDMEETDQLSASVSGDAEPPES